MGSSGDHPPCSPVPAAHDKTRAGRAQWLSPQAEPRSHDLDRPDSQWPESQSSGQASAPYLRPRDPRRRRGAMSRAGGRTRPFPRFQAEQRRASSDRLDSRSARDGRRHHHQSRRLHPYVCRHHGRAERRANFRSSKCIFPTFTSREDFRHRSYVSLVAAGVIAGFGVHGYQLALRHMALLLARK